LIAADFVEADSYAMSDGSAEYREKAAECRRQAQGQRGKARDMLVDLARYWETLADRKSPGKGTTPCVFKSKRRQADQSPA
jgi:hypothetical protein